MAIVKWHAFYWFYFYPSNGWHIHVSFGVSCATIGIIFQQFFVLHSSPNSFTSGLRPVVNSCFLIPRIGVDLFVQTKPHGKHIWSTHSTLNQSMILLSFECVIAFRISQLLSTIKLYIFDTDLLFVCYSHCVLILLNLFFRTAFYLFSSLKIARCVKIWFGQIANLWRTSALRCDTCAQQRSRELRCITTVFSSILKLNVVGCYRQRNRTTHSYQKRFISIRIVV